MTSPTRPGSIHSSGDPGGASDGAWHAAGAGSLPADVGDVDDPAAANGAHSRDGGLAAADGGHELEVDVRDPVLVRELVEGRAGVAAGIVDEDIDAAEVAERLLDEGFAAFAGGDVGGDGEDIATVRGADLGGGGFKDILAAGTDGDAAAFADEFGGAGLADAFAAASDKGDFSGEFQVHGRSLRGAAVGCRLSAARVRASGGDMPGHPD